MATIDLEKLARLPSLPTVAIELLRTLANPESAAHEVVNLIAADPALSGRVLAAANSARLGGGRAIGDLHRAALLLGKRVVCSLALGFTLSEASMTRGRHAELFQAFWLRSFAQALAARTLAERFGGCPADEAFTLGLIARVGQLALLKHMPDPFAECVAESERGELSPEQVEKERLGVASQELTLRMLARWNLPESFQAAVQTLSDTTDERSVMGEPGLPSYLRIAVSTADLIGSAQRGRHLIRLNDALARLTLPSDDDVEWLVVSVSKQLRQNSELFHVDLSQIGTPAELLSEATEQLTRLAIAGFPQAEVRPLPEELVEENGQLRQQVAALMRESTTDPLTGVFNRRYFHRRLRDQATRAAECGSLVGVLIGDLDRFKAVNDTYGHPTGDRLLAAVAEAIEGTVRGGDLVARYGGEEFVVLVEVASVDGLRAAGERIRKAIAGITLPTERGPLTATISLGGCAGTPSADLADFEARLLAAADRCLYEAKSAGRNRVLTALLPAARPTVPPPTLGTVAGRRVARLV